MIEAIELTGTRRSRTMVDKVSFDVYPGQVTALLGAPGTGKSTVLRMMVELEPGSGRTLFGGRPYHALRPAVREVGLALNPDALHPGRTVQAHLALYSAAGGVSKARIGEVLEVTGLSLQTTVRCGRLDPGQRQRLAIAAALLGDPAALILDEPHALDTHGMTWFHALIRAYAAQGRTVLVAASDVDSLAGTADHVIVLRRDEEDGRSRVIASRSAAEVFDQRRATVILVRSPQAARLAAALEGEGAHLASAGPGALQVRGLDRARIGEVAHVAGICLHELTEIGHDDDVFGLRPVPRQMTLTAGASPAETGDAPGEWRSGVRLVRSEAEEAEQIEEAAAGAAGAEVTTQTAVMPVMAESALAQSAVMSVMVAESALAQTAVMSAMVVGSASTEAPDERVVEARSAKVFGDGRPEVSDERAVEARSTMVGSASAEASDERAVEARSAQVVGDGQAAARTAAMAAVQARSARDVGDGPVVAQTASMAAVQAASAQVVGDGPAAARTAAMAAVQAGSATAFEPPPADQPPVPFTVSVPQNPSDPSDEGMTPWRAAIRQEPVRAEAHAEAHAAEAARAAEKEATA